MAKIGKVGASDLRIIGWGLLQGDCFRYRVGPVNVGGIVEQAVAVFGLDLILIEGIYPEVAVHETVVVIGRRVVPLRAVIHDEYAVIPLQDLVERVVLEPFRKYRAWRQ